VPYSHPQPIDKQDMVRRTRHLIPGAFAFAAIAGFINSVSLGFFHSPVSHMTGAVSYLGIDLADGRFRDSLTTISIIVGFIGGAAITGFIVGARRLLPGRQYGVALFCEAGLLAASTALLLSGSRMGVPFAAMACGVQNAMTSSYCGLMIRTTHVTGTVTDIGAMIGHWFRHREIEFWKLRFMVLVVIGFGSGVWLGAIANARCGPASLGFAAVACGVAAFIVWFFAGKGWLGLELEEAPPSPRTASFPDLQ
jgi:uncharacterized membrane protein YoaK (UPF0700 family)